MDAKPTPSETLHEQMAGRVCRAEPETEMVPMYRTYPGRDGHPTRNLDGSPETEVHKRYFALRESGYTGWIDQDGFAVDGPSYLDADGNRVWGFEPGLGAKYAPVDGNEDEA